MRRILLLPTFVALSSSVLLGQAPPGEGPALGTNRITQADITSGLMTETELRLAGQKMFATPFNRHDGYGDGPMSPTDTISPGGRPTLQGNGTFLRVNGLDAQTCIECHSVGSNAVVPFRFGVGGVGGSASNAIFQPKEIDVDDDLGWGYAAFDGRFINPPFLFGSGGVELLGKEMTSDLQRLRRLAQLSPDQPVPLVTHGVDFGTLTYVSAQAALDTSQVVGVDEDLVVRPFGRKGEFHTVRAFDVDAMRFHFGMEPVEFAGDGVDADGDGVVNEVLVGELSVLHLFNTSLKSPVVDFSTPAIEAGRVRFDAVGCATCHVPELETRQRVLPLSFPDDGAKPWANAFYGLDLVASNAGFAANGQGGVTVPMFSDLKRHDMGPGLAEAFGHGLDSQFITARLWGVADTAPYLHDGRATTLTAAILAHGGEAQAARDAFDALPDAGKVELLTFLRSLRTPTDPTGGL